MPRKVQGNSSDLPYFISARCINREWFTIPLPDVATVMENYIFFLHHAYGAKIHGYVLLSNHIHILVSFPLGNMSEAMNYFMRETSRTIGKIAGRINQVYGSRFHRCLITNNHHFTNVYKYLYRNPVEAGLCNKVELYPYSTLGGLLGLQKISTPLLNDHLLFSNPENVLAWLNKEPPEQYKIDMKTALRKNVFGFPGKGKNSKRHPLEIEIY